MKALQETFDLSGLSLIAQGGPAIDDGACMYLAPNGRRCAAGHLMTAPDNVLRDAVGFITCPQNAKFLEAHDINLVRALQQAHDQAAIQANDEDKPWRGEWLKNIADAARKFGLDPSRVVSAAREAGWEVPVDL